MKKTLLIVIAILGLSLAAVAQPKAIGVRGGLFGPHFNGETEDGCNQDQCLFHTAEGFKLLRLFYLTMPLKPMKASARMPTLTRAMGTPLNALGTSHRARCSRIPAKITIARP